MSGLFGYHIVGFPTRWLNYQEASLGILLHQNSSVTDKLAAKPLIPLWKCLQPPFPKMSGSERLILNLLITTFAKFAKFGFLQ